MNADLSAQALELRLKRAGELHRLAVSLRDAHTPHGVEVPVFAVILRALVRRFGEVHDLTATGVWTSAVCWALVDVRTAIAHSVGLLAEDIDLRCDDTQPRYDFVWLERSDQKHLLAVESEWGANGRGKQATNDARVCYDFDKLTRADCSARYRLLVYSYHPSSVDRLEEDLARSARAAPPAPYLFVGLPWDEPVLPRLHAWSLRPQGNILLWERLPTPIG